MNKSAERRMVGGIDATLHANLHRELRQKYGKASKCENPECPHKHPKNFNWALKRGHQYSAIRDDYFQLCNSCHKKYDETDESRKRRSLRVKGKLCHDNRRSVKKIDDFGNVVIYQSISEAARMTNIWRTDINNCVTKRYKQAGGYKWEYN